MRSGLAVVLLVYSMSVVVVARGEDSPHVRGLDPWALESLERGRQGSQLFRELLQTLEASDLIAHVETSTRLAAGIAGTTRFVADTGAYRYVRITLHRDLPADVRAATLAHELQHAVELARAQVRTPVDMLRLYVREGYRTGADPTYYETAAAEQAGLRAWRELHGSKVTAAGQQ